MKKKSSKEPSGVDPAARRQPWLLAYCLRAPVRAKHLGWRRAEDLSAFIVATLEMPRFSMSAEPLPQLTHLCSCHLLALRKRQRKWSFQRQRQMKTVAPGLDTHSPPRPLPSFRGARVCSRFTDSWGAVGPTSVICRQSSQPAKPQLAFLGPPHSWVPHQPSGLQRPDTLWTVSPSSETKLVLTCQCV